VTERPKISVVIAVRDDESTIQRAVSSALRQNSPPIEVIVVDDKSEDATRQRIGEMKSRQVVILDGAGRGAGAARNVGVKHASGNWIAFLDGDDFWAPDFLEFAGRRIQSAPAAVACFGASIAVDGDGRAVGAGNMPAAITQEALIRGKIYHSTSATLVKRDALVACGGFFEDLTHAVEDIDLWLRLAAFGECVGFSQVASFFEVHPEHERQRPSSAIAKVERDYDMMMDRFASSNAPAGVVRKGRAVTDARIARFWLDSGRADRSRARAMSSIRTFPTREGLVAMAFSCVPRGVYGRLSHRMHLRRAQRIAQEEALDTRRAAGI
jgi:glycosyltransferase involved in cell wall biosynthesis